MFEFLKTDAAHKYAREQAKKAYKQAYSEFFTINGITVPCHCGESPTIVTWLHLHTIRCSKFDCGSIEAKTQEQAIKLWNDLIRNGC